MTSPSSQLVEIDLDKPRQFRFTIFDARDACRYLSNIPGKGHVDSLRLIMLLASRDYDAWAAVLSEGLKHEEDGIRPDRALRYLSEYVNKGGDMAVLAKSIRKAGELGGVWEPIDEGEAEGSSARPSRESRSST
jgi:hypothetical protein